MVKFFIKLEYGGLTNTSHILGMIFFFIQGYLSVLQRRELFVEIYNRKKSFESWKKVLDICHEGIIIYKNKEIFYYNEGFNMIVKKFDIVDYGVNL